MSVIAGCSFFHGVMLLSDCRMTVSRVGRSNVHIDNVQKLFALTPTSAIGFVGDIELAGLLLRELLAQLPQKARQKKVDAVSLFNWIPRYLRSAYERVCQRHGSPSVKFVVGSVLPGYPNVIERAKVRAIMERFRLGKLSAQRNWLPSILVDILKTPPDVTHVLLQDAPLGLLYFLGSPSFDPICLEALEFGVIGSGEGATLHIERDLDWIFAGDVGNPFMEAMALRETVDSFIREQNVESVGGLYPCIRLGADGLNVLGYSTEIPLGGTRIELSVNEKRRWVQKNLSTGKEIGLLYPWEITASQYIKDQKFDDYVKAFEDYGSPS